MKQEITCIFSLFNMSWSKKRTNELIQFIYERNISVNEFFQIEIMQWEIFKKEFEFSLKEIQDLKSKIQELETHPTIQDDNPDILALILDETQTDRYAPDLVYSIKLWLDVYVNNPKADSHNNKANTWIKNNTPYNGEQDDTPTRRIREIATPFRDLHQSRKRLLENK